jgi:DNA repair protein RadA/Sms
MTKTKTQYICNECGATSPKWAGQCPDCSSWNSLEETIINKKTGHLANSNIPVITSVVRTLNDVEISAQPRTAIGIAELDRVLGGGIVGGSVILIGGDPGIGKSTILLQMVAKLSNIHNISTLYVSGEESLQQLGLRGIRLGLDLSTLKSMSENQVEQIFSAALEEQPQVLIVDSIQTVFTEQLTSAPGSVSQVRECASQLVRYAKQTNTAVILVGHVTKEGTLAGPRVLEHMVDTVLYFEGDNTERYRIIRSVKNRFGAVNELGIFAMTDLGLKEVTNPSAIFVSSYQDNTPGSIIVVTREGSRPLLVEVQSLVNSAHGQQPRRVTVGLENNRLAMLLAIMERYLGVTIYDQDIFVNVVGGVRIGDTSADLPIVLSILSSMEDIALPKKLVAFGEIGLGGEVRPVQGGQERLSEAVKHGFSRAIIPVANRPRKAMTDIEVNPITKLHEIIPMVLNKK